MVTWAQRLFYFEHKNYFPYILYASCTVHFSVQIYFTDCYCHILLRKRQKSYTVVLSLPYR